MIRRLLSLYLALVLASPAHAVSILDFIPDEDEHLLETTYPADNAMQAALASGEPEIEMVCGNYLFSETIYVERPIRIHGQRGGPPHSLCANMAFHVEPDGVVVQKGAGGPFVHGVILERLNLHSFGTTGDGIRARSAVHLDKVSVSGFGDDCIDLGAHVGLGENTNNWIVTDSHARGCKNGLHAYGDNANAGIAINLDVRLNDDYGVLDESFLGNTYQSPHAAGNGLAPYKTTNQNARHLFLNPYAEQGQGAAELTHPTMVVGGLLPAGVSGSATVLQPASSTPFRVLNGAGSRLLSITIGQVGNRFMQMIPAGDNPRGWEWLYSPIVGGILLQHGNSQGRIAFGLTTDLGEEGTNPWRDEADDVLPGGELIMQGAWAHTGAGQRFRYVDFFAMSEKMAELEQRIEALEPTSP